jgi:hypothetical protein
MQIQASRITSSGHAMGPRILGRSRSQIQLPPPSLLDEVRIASHNNLSLAANVLELSAGGPREVQEYLFFNVGSLVVLGWCPAPHSFLAPKENYFLCHILHIPMRGLFLNSVSGLNYPSRSEPESAMSSSYIAAEEIQ